MLVPSHCVCMLKGARWGPHPHATYTSLAEARATGACKLMLLLRAALDKAEGRIDRVCTGVGLGGAVAAVTINLPLVWPAKRH
jgi:hypothetical protein